MEGCIRHSGASLAEQGAAGARAGGAVAAAAVAGEDEAAPVCIGSCLVDISYSETKRRHVPG